MPANGPELYHLVTKTKKRCVLSNRSRWQQAMYTLCFVKGFPLHIGDLCWLSNKIIVSCRTRTPQPRWNRADAHVAASEFEFDRIKRGGKKTKKGHTLIYKRACQTSGESMSQYFICLTALVKYECVFKSKYYILKPQQMHFPKMIS